jgi:hypothetical protein
MLAASKQVDNKEGKACTRSGMIEYVADGTHEAHVALMLCDARVTPRERRVALLEFANPAQRRLRYPCRLRSKTSSVRRCRVAILRRR